MRRIQPLPKRGVIGRNAGLPLPVLLDRLADQAGSALSYVLTSLKLQNESQRFEQHGSAPNFQGGVLTLCTCKHRMRAGRSPKEWKGTWIAGFSSRTLHRGDHWLYYLARIENGYESHTDLWQRLSTTARNAKVAHKNFLGDVFEPKSPIPIGDARFRPNQYFRPTLHAHRQHPGDEGWRHDVNYQHAAKFGHPALLLADPKQTFLWDEPMIRFAGPHCRSARKWGSLSDLLDQLRHAQQY